MMTEIRTHLTHYTVLAVWFTLGLIALTWWRFNTPQQLAVVVAMAVGYFIWGVVHHSIIRDITGKIVLEYLLVAILSIMIVWAVFAQA